MRVWDKLSWLNQISAVLIVLSLLTYLTAAWAWVTHQSSFVVRQVFVQGYWRHIDLQQVKEVAMHSTYGNFFSVNLDRLRHSFERIPWVSHVVVERLWPWRVSVVLYEPIPVARWGRHALLSSDGSLFSGSVDFALPQFWGPEGTEQEMLLFYKQFNELMEPLHSQVDELRLTPSYSWSALLNNHFIIRVGSDYKDDVALRRVARFVRTWRTMKLDMKNVRSVDLRYPNGFAMRLTAKARGFLLKRGVNES